MSAGDKTGRALRGILFSLGIILVLLAGAIASGGAWGYSLAIALAGATLTAPKLMTNMKYTKKNQKAGRPDGPMGVPGAYVHTSQPLDPKDVELIRNCIRDCQKEWAKEKEPPQK